MANESESLVGMLLDLNNRDKKERHSEEKSKLGGIKEWSEKIVDTGVEYAEKAYKTATKYAQEEGVAKRMIEHEQEKSPYERLSKEQQNFVTALGEYFLKDLIGESAYSKLKGNNQALFYYLKEGENEEDKSIVNMQALLEHLKSSNAYKVVSNPSAVLFMGNFENGTFGEIDGKKGAWIAYNLEATRLNEGEILLKNGLKMIEKRELKNDISESNEEGVEEINVEEIEEKEGLRDQEVQEAFRNGLSDGEGGNPISFPENASEGYKAIYRDGYAKGYNGEGTEEVEALKKDIKDLEDQRRSREKMNKIFSGPIEKIKLSQ